jgi:hypothetical protein
MLHRDCLSTRLPSVTPTAAAASSQPAPIPSAALSAAPPPEPPAPSAAPPAKRSKTDAKSDGDDDDDDDEVRPLRAVLPRCLRPSDDVPRPRADAPCSERHAAHRAQEEEAEEEEEEGASASQLPIDTALEHVRTNGAAEPSLDRLKAKPLKALRCALGEAPGREGKPKNLAAIIRLFGGRAVEKAIAAIADADMEAARQIKPDKPRPQQVSGPYAKRVLPLPTRFPAPEPILAGIAGSRDGARSLIVCSTGTGKSSLLAGLAAATVARGSRVTPLGPFSYELWGADVCAAVEQLGALSIADVQGVLPPHVRLLRLNGAWLQTSDGPLKQRLKTVEPLLKKEVAAALRNKGDGKGANKLITSKSLLQAPHVHSQRLCALLETAFGTHDLGQFLPMSRDRQQRRLWELYEVEGLQSEVGPDAAGSRRQTNWTNEHQQIIRDKCACTPRWRAARNVATTHTPRHLPRMPPQMALAIAPKV